MSVIWTGMLLLFFVTGFPVLDFSFSVSVNPVFGLSRSVHVYIWVMFVLFRINAM